MKKRWMFLAIIPVFVSVAFVFASSQKGEDAYLKLMEGNKRFVSATPSHKDIGEVKRKELAKGQHPLP